MSRTGQNQSLSKRLKKTPTYASVADIQRVSLCVVDLQSIEKKRYCLVWHDHDRVHKKGLSI